MRLALAFCAALIAVPAHTQEIDHAALLDRVLDGAILPGFADFVGATETLSTAATRVCAEGQGDLRAPFAATYAAWAAVDAYHFGPVEERGAVLSVNFWPDKKNFVGRALRSLQTATPEQLADPAFLDGQSAAAQGLPALERIIVAGEPCPLAPAIAAHLAKVAVMLEAEWTGAEGWAALMREAGPANPIYLTPQEASAELYKALEFGLQRLSDARLGRPLGTFDAPRPKRAEAWRSDLSRANILAQFNALELLYRAAFAPLPDTDALDEAWAATRKVLDRLPPSIAEAVQQPGTRLKVEAAQTKINSLNEAIGLTLAPRLGIAIGFNAADGD